MPDRLRVQMTIRGAVQGVGFRPFIYRLATGMALNGWVRNSSQGVIVEAEGDKSRLDAFLVAIGREKPPRSFIQSLESRFLDPVGLQGFEIRHSEEIGSPTALVLPDVAVCDDCRREIFDPADRRNGYPFTNCTNCGPRYSIIEALPYDRATTTMKRFEMCADCRAEYENPLDRRFHAQPNACPACGPHLELLDESGRFLSRGAAALRAAARALREGRIVAVMGLGGFHLMADARDEAAVLRLRERKHREEKPFALMVPSLESVKAVCEVSALEERLLGSPEAPIVLLRRRSEISNLNSRIAPSVAPRNPYLGVLLPYTPLHLLLTADLGFPVVATSGNRSDEPICTDASEALDRLGGIADLFLTHNRPIARPVDDSVVRVVAGRELVLRRARGYAPFPVRLRRPAPPMLAVGGHQKNTVALTAGSDIFISQHVGDLGTREAYESFEKTVGSLGSLYASAPREVVCDLHPDYPSAAYAKSLGLPVTRIQHHHAHAAACMAENGLEGEVLAAAWDGTGYGPDGTVWGGEFLRTDAAEYERFAAFRTFPLPGGEAAAREPRRCAIGLLYELWGGSAFAMGEVPTIQAFTPIQLGLLRRMLDRELNTPRSSSAGRLFDAVASLAGIRQRAGFEAQAAMELEFVVDGDPAAEAYPFEILPGNGADPRAPRWIVDWGPMVAALLGDRTRGVSTAVVSAGFHAALAEIIVSAARLAGLERVVLTGGCFQNRLLTERAVRRLRESGFRPYWHQRIPPNDGGLSLGQAFAAIRAAEKRGAGREAAGLSPAVGR